jgi:hypothetical protein
LSPPPPPPPLPEQAIAALQAQAAENGVTRSLLQYWLVFRVHSSGLAAAAGAAAPAPSADLLAAALNSPPTAAFFAGKCREFRGCVYV